MRKKTINNKVGAPQNLIQIKKGDTKIPRMGGLVCSENKKRAALNRVSKKTKCKNCKANCPFRTANLERSKEHVCIVPEARAHAIWYNQPVWSKEVFMKISHETLLLMRSKCDSMRDFKLLHSSLIDQARYDYPIVDQVTVQNNMMQINILSVEKKEQMIKDLIEK